MDLRISRLKINEDVDSELCYWVRSLLAALRLGAALALTCGLAIAALAAAGSASAFARDFWPWLVECAFWLGMLLGMLWGAGKRLGSSLAGTLPWLETKDEGAAAGRVFGQWAAFAALSGFCLWLGRQAAIAAGMRDMAELAGGLSPVASACWLAAGLFALIAVASRARRPLPRPRP